MIPITFWLAALFVTLVGLLIWSTVAYQELYNASKIELMINKIVWIVWLSGFIWWIWSVIQLVKG